MGNGYDYVLALTDAIERWSAAAVRADPGAFIHRGADLRHAVERSLFFELANTTSLSAAFAATGQVDVTVPRISLPRRLRYEAGNLSRLLRRSFTTARLRQSPDILFLAIHPKFVTFLKPIADALGDRAAYLTVEDGVTEAHLEKHGLAAIAVQQGFTPRLVKQGANSHWVSLYRAFDQLSVMLQKMRPAVIVVPEGNAPVYEIANKAGRQHGVATIYMQHGAPAYTNPGFRNWTFADALVWGARFVEPLARHNPAQHFTAIGTPASFGMATPRDREPVRVVGFFLQKAAGVIPTAEWEAMLSFIVWLAASFPDIEVLVREHPTQPRLEAQEMAPLENLPNLRFVPAPAFRLNDVLSRCDVVVAAASTTLLEAVAVGAVPFILGTAYPADFPALASEGAGVAAPTLESAKVAMTQLVADQNLRAALRRQGERLRPQLFAAMGQEGADRIAAHLRAAADRRAR